MVSAYVAAMLTPLSFAKSILTYNFESPEILRLKLHDVKDPWVLAFWPFLWIASLHQGNLIFGSTMTSLGGWAIAHARVDDVPQKGDGVGMEDGHEIHVGQEGLTDADALDGAKHTAYECMKSVPCSARLGYCQWALCCMRISLCSLVLNFLFNK